MASTTVIIMQLTASAKCPCHSVLSLTIKVVAMHSELPLLSVFLIVPLTWKKKHADTIIFLSNRSFASCPEENDPLGKSNALQFHKVEDNYGI